MSDTDIVYPNEFEGSPFGNDPFGIEQSNDHHDSSELQTHHGIEFLDNLEEKVEHFVEKVLGKEETQARFRGIQKAPSAIWIRNARPDGIRVRTYALQANVPIQIADKATNRYRITITNQAANPVSLADTTNAFATGSAHSVAITPANGSRTIEAKCDLWAVCGVASVIDVVEEFYTNQSL